MHQKRWVDHKAKRWLRSEIVRSYIKGVKIQFWGVIKKRFSYLRTNT